MRMPFVKKRFSLRLFGAVFLIFVFVCPPSQADLLEDVAEESTESDLPSADKARQSGQGLIQDENQRSSPARLPSNNQPKSTVPGGAEPATEGGKHTRPADSRVKKSGDKGPQKANGPIRFKSRDFAGDKSGGFMILETDVVVTQDDLKINADKATLRFDQRTNDIIEVIAVGNVKFFRIDPETNEPVTADSKEAIFNNAERTVILKGDPRMIRGKDVVRGKQISYDLNTGWVKASRVEGVVQPPQGDEKKQN
jgi:lipopolysaccharide export system protein LptA